MSPASYVNIRQNLFQCALCPFHRNDRFWSPARCQRIGTPVAYLERGREAGRLPTVLNSSSVEERKKNCGGRRRGVPSEGGWGLFRPILFLPLNDGKIRKVGTLALSCHLSDNITWEGVRDSNFQGILQFIYINIYSVHGIYILLYMLHVHYI